MVQVNDNDAAARLARTIVSDIAIYNREKVARGIKEDNIFELLENELAEGLDLYRSRLSPDLDTDNKLYNRAIVDVLIKRSGDIESDIW